MTDIAEHAAVIAVSGGRRLSARLWRPVQAGRWPAILDAAPYRAGDLFRTRVEGQMPYFAAHGYAALAVDIAGSGSSTGLLTDEYTPTEIGDLVEAIAWCARQDWCDGKVGLSGLSWAAFAALRAAEQQPPALKAMVLGGVSEDGWRTDIHYLGGALYTAHIDWAAVMLMLNALPPDPAQFDGDWRAAWKARLEANEPWITHWLEHPARDAYWKDKASILSATVPLLLYSGLADKYTTSVLRIASAWRGPVRTIIGPWEHAPPNVAARGPRIGFLQEAVRWWDKFLKGRETGALDEAPLRLWLAAPGPRGDLKDGRWIALDGPPAEAMTFAVRGAALVHGGEPDDRPVALAAARSNPQALTEDLYEDAPAPFDWPRARELGAQVAFSEPFAADCAIGMTPALRCRCETSHAILVARLLDIAPDGSAIRMTTGAFNLQHAADGKVSLPLQATAWRIRKGHRLGLVVSSDGWPTFWPSRTGLASVSGMRLELPVIAPRPDEPTFPPPLSASFAAPQRVKWIDIAAEKLPPAPPGAVSLSEAAAFHLAATGTDYFTASRLDLLPIGVSDARAVKSYRVAFERPGWSIRIDTQLDVSSTPDAFHIAWRIDAWEGKTAFHSTARTTSIARTVV
jgi:hypothetical protein